MGATASSYEPSISVEAFSKAEGSLGIGAERDVLVSRKYKAPAETTLNARLTRYACPSDSSICHDLLPGHVDEWKGWTDEDVLSSGSFEGYPR